MNKVFIKKTHRTEDSSLQINISMLQVIIEVTMAVSII